jgi:Domain of unknown function (DUF1929)
MAGYAMPVRATRRAPWRRSSKPGPQWQQFDRRGLGGHVYTGPSPEEWQGRSRHRAGRHHRHDPGISGLAGGGADGLSTSAAQFDPAAGWQGAGDGGIQVGSEEAEAVYTAELWDPASESWTTLASMHVARMYHSTVLLVPDGRVLLARGNGKLSAELYAPPYLFGEPPAEIAAATARLAYGASFRVATPEAVSIAVVVLLWPSAVTHACNQKQRHIGLRFEPTEKGALGVQAPAHANLAAPGHYMLSLVSTAGVPSRAWFFQIGREENTPGVHSSIRVGSIRPRDDAAGGR